MFRTLRGYAAAISCSHDPVGGLSIGKQPVGWGRGVCSSQCFWYCSINSAIELQVFQPEPSCQTELDLWTLSSKGTERICQPYTTTAASSHTAICVLWGDTNGPPGVQTKVVSLVGGHHFPGQGFPVPEGLVAHSTCSMATSWAALKGVEGGSSVIEYSLYFCQVPQS